MRNKNFLLIELLARVIVCHSRGSNRESSVFEKRGSLDSRLRGNDGESRTFKTFARISIIAAFFVITFQSQSFCSENLIPNPDFAAPAGSELSPYFWYHGNAEVEGVIKSTFSVGPAGSPSSYALGIKGGDDRSGEWWCRLEGLEKGRRYALSFKVFRETFREGVYPEVELFDKKIRLNNHLTFGAWQGFTLIFTASAESSIMKFINNNSAEFYFSSPALVKIADSGEEGAAVIRRMPGITRLDFFPLIAYGAKEEDFSFIRSLGFNGCVIGVNDNSVAGILKASRISDLRLVVNAAGDEAIKKISDANNVLGWYVEDEPEGRSVPVEYILSKIEKIRKTDSARPTFMAMVRPEFTKYYEDAADIILMDQYPVPHLPIIWLSKSMEDAKRQSGEKEIWAVIQIFGGQGWKGGDWNREPTYEEMKALSYLAIVHGARGLFFYTVKDGNYDLRLDASHVKDVRNLVQELRFLSPIFLSEPAGVSDFFPDSLHEYAPDGTRPVHAKIFKSDKLLMIIAVNVLDKEVNGRLSGMRDGIAYMDEYFSGKRYVVKNHAISDNFGPYEVKLYIAGKDFKKVKITDGNTGAFKADFYSELAKTEFDKTLGLMFRDIPSEGRALMLEEDTGRDLRIHALNMKKPFDIVFIDRSNIVSAVYKSVPPCDDGTRCRLYSSDKPSSAVLELRAGTIEKKNILPGDNLEFY